MTTVAIISFDFDDTLLLTAPDEEVGLVEIGPNPVMIRCLLEHARAGDTVIIVTSRHEKHERNCPFPRTAVADFVKEHELPVSGVFFTNGRDKASLLVSLGVAQHFDDDPFELSLLRGTYVRGVLVGNRE